MRPARRAMGMILAMGVLLGATVFPASAQQPTGDPPFTMTLGARIQARYSATDPAGTHTFRVQRARLSLSGNAYEHFTYAMQAAFEGTGARLLDANIRYSYSPALTLWVGQGKAYFGRQFLISSANLQFVDRTIVDARFSGNRQQGIALLGRLAEDRLEYNLGLYNGDGIGQSVNADDRSMLVGRLVFTPWGAYSLTESALDNPDDPRLAVGISALRNSQGTDADRVGIARMNLEAAFKLRGFSLTGEFFREWADPVEGMELTADGWYLQGGVLFGNQRQELAGRMAGINPEVEGEGNSDQVETGIAYSYYFRGHNAKLQTDLRNIRSELTDTDARELRVQLQIAM